jgi:hypothetical protein
MVKGNWRNLLGGGKRELEKSVTRCNKGTWEICYGEKKGSWKNLSQGGKMELGKSASGWKKGTGEIC